MHDDGRDLSGPQILRRIAGPDLHGLVTEITGYAENGLALTDVSEVASLTIPLIVSFGTPFRIGLGRKAEALDCHQSFAAGLFLGPVLMESDGQAQCLQINFTPLGARRFFGLPMDELADRMVSLDDLGDREIDVFARQLGDLNSWHSRIVLAERFVAARLCRGAVGDPETSWAFQQLIASGGRIRIGAVADKLGWSRRRLVECFRRDIGYPPKAVARIARFNAAATMARATQPDWADIAAACGYADQAHLTREFSRLAGRPPQAWRSAA